MHAHMISMHEPQHEFEMTTMTWGEETVIKGGREEDGSVSLGQIRDVVPGTWTN